MNRHLNLHAPIEPFLSQLRSLQFRLLRSNSLQNRRVSRGVGLTTNYSNITNKKNWPEHSFDWFDSWSRKGDLRRCFRAWYLSLLLYLFVPAAYAISHIR